MSKEKVLTKREGNVFYIKFNRPQRKNAIDTEVYQSIIDALNTAAKDEEILVTVITGVGDYYSSGNDLSMFATMTGDPVAKVNQGSDLLVDFVNAFIDFPKILIAAVNGPAIGVSVTTLALCDFVYASESATFHTPFMTLAQCPEACSSLLFVQLMGLQKANEILLGGKKFNAREAETLGLVNAVFSDSEFQTNVANIVKTMAALPPQALVLSKKLIREKQIPVWKEVNRREANLLRERWLSEECLNAAFSFLNRPRSKM
eukprot:TRINITY_DN1202_c0_g5_i1.p1 TRINITY_DN1202_c0_g5~~TRINITY_DN1202_c0_g5_i1.p1  ORF type:complete len:260 (-),score=44.19 TRINITY_DN1202_c0_g5_i1:78-857(-)